MSAHTDKVLPCTLRSGLSALGSGGQSFEEGSHLRFMYLNKTKKRKIEQCHKLLSVLGVDLAQTRSYGRRWQVARIGLCGRGAVWHACRIKKILNCPLTVRAGNL